MSETSVTTAGRHAMDSRTTFGVPSKRDDRTVVSNAVSEKYAVFAEVELVHESRHIALIALRTTKSTVQLVADEHEFDWNTF